MCYIEKAIAPRAILLYKCVGLLLDDIGVGTHKLHSKLRKCESQSVVFCSCKMMKNMLQIVGRHESCHCSGLK